MNLNLKGVTAIAAIALLSTGTASAQLNDGLDGSNATSVFISVVERDATNAATRNLVIDTGLNAFQIWDGTAIGWNTTAAQATAIQGFLNSASGTVSFNLGAGLTLTNTEDYGIATTGTSQGPEGGTSGALAALNTGRTNIIAFVNNANLGSFVDGVLEVPGAADPGFHGIGEWGNSFGGAIQPSNEILFGDTAPIQGWRLNFAAQGIVNEALALLNSDIETGALNIAVIPVPAAVWLFGSALGLLGWVRRRAAQ